jgi:hypothetical protein
MHHLRAWGVLALLAILGGTAAAADPDESVPANYDRGAAAFTRWNAGRVEPPKPPPVSPQVAAAKARERDTAAAVRAQEEANLLRRLAACNRLRELAVQTGDESLEQLADELEKKAGTVFTARTTALAGGREPGADSDARVAANKREGKR